MSVPRIEKVNLTDGHTDDKTVVPCDVEIGSGAILIRPEGFGDCSSQDGHGWPIVVEYYQGSVRVHVWSDINNCDPTHSIVLDGAKESLRNTD